MGRALFSQAYATPAPAVTVRTEPEPTFDICERWLSYSHFDPDSEEFFQDAEYEAFIDPEQAAREEEISALLTEQATTEVSDSSEGSISGQGSPMAVGSDDPAALIADAYSNRTTWNDEEAMSPIEPEWRTTRATGSASVSMRSPVVRENHPYAIRVSRQEPVFIPPPIETDARIYPSPAIRRSVNILPLSSLLNPAGPEDRSPSPDSPGPSTPPPQVSFPYRRQAQTTVSSSLPSSVIPRFYSRQHHSIPAIPAGSTLIHGNRDGPLTNPRARMSFARIASSPARIRIPNTVM